MVKVTIDLSIIFNVLFVDLLITYIPLLTNGLLNTYMVLFSIDPLITQGKPYGFVYR